MFYTTTTRTNRWGEEVEERVLDTKRVAIAIASGVAALILMIIVLCSVCKIPTGHTGVITSFGKVENYTYDAGIHIKAPWKKVIKMDNRVQKQSVELQCFSSDIQEVKIVYTINYQINKDNAMIIYSTIGREYYDIAIIPNITESVKVVTARYTAEKLVGTRDELALAIEKDLTERLREFNIELVSTSIEDMDFTDAYTNAVEAKQVAQQNKLKAETEAEQKVIEAEANAEVARVKAQGEADAKRIAAEAEAEANKKIAASLDERVLKNKWYEKWNGEYPQVVSGGGTIIEFPMGD
jgi:regulator of protease activity HflC (stomatin/prohibitin superfamily)